MESQATAASSAWSDSAPLQDHGRFLAGDEEEEEDDDWESSRAGASSELVQNKYHQHTGCSSVLSVQTGAGFEEEDDDNSLDA